MSEWVTCLPADCCFSELALSLKQQSAGRHVTPSDMLSSFYSASSLKQQSAGKHVTHSDMLSSFYDDMSEGVTCLPADCCFSELAL
jgi:hypothetical protein